MATTLTVQNTSRTGLDLSTATAADAAGNNFANSGVEMLYVKNPTGGSITLTEVITQTVDSQVVTNRAVVVTAGQQLILGPYNVGQYNDASSRVGVTYSAGGLTVMAFKQGA